MTAPLRRHRRVLASALALALALCLGTAACADDDPSAQPAGPPGEATTSDRDEAAAPDSTTADTTPSGTATPGGTGTGTAATLPPAAPGSWADAPIRLEPITEVPRAIALTGRPGTLDLYVAGREGQVWRLGRTRDGSGRETWAPEPELVLDISDEVSTDGERGLLGLAFSPDGSVLYLSYTDRDGRSMLESVSVPGTTADAATRRVLLSVDQPFANHNGGHVAIGPDGMLYLGLGDGGSGGDPQGNGQDPRALLGSLLRIEPTPGADQPYRIPADNPFADGADGAPEVWLYGVRNPWRFSFDRATGDLWLADVGQSRWEEVDLLRADQDQGGRGANLGWNRMEGLEPYEGGTEPEGHHAPVFVYPLDGRCSIIGGAMYRGTRVPALAGVYLFGDLCTGELRGLQVAPDGVAESGLPVSATGGALVSFGEDTEGELYVVELTGGVHRLAPAG